MIKTALLTLVLLASPAPVFAASEAHVNINNNVSGDSTSNVSSRTDITVETDGNTTRYTSDEPGTIEINSINGVTEIKKNGTVVSGNNSNSPTKEPTASPTAKPTQKPDENNNQNKNIFEVFEDVFKKLFSLLS